MKHLNCSSFNIGDIVVVPIPFSNQTESKLRPALVLSNEFFNVKYPDLILAKITSIGHSLPYDVVLNKNDLPEGNLLKDSTINCGFVITVNKDIIQKKIGRISPNKIDEVKEKIKELFAL